MNLATARAMASGAILAFAIVLPAPAATTTQASHYTSQPVTLGTGGYLLNFSILWVCDDAPQGTTSAPGRIDLIDAGGNLAGSLTATIAGGAAKIATQGVGTTSNAQVWIYQLGAGGTPANGFLTGSWLLAGLAPGAYTLRFWYFQEAVSGSFDSTITTQAAVGAGGGEVNAAPSPTPTPTPSPLPPTITLSAPPVATVLSPASLNAAASAQAGGNPLASVAIDLSMDNGTTWTAIETDSQAANPSDTESIAYSFAQVGTAIVRATATDTGGLTASAQQSVSVVKAGQSAIAISPSSGSVSQGQSLAFTASGGATGNYVWSGSASGSGPSQTVTFPATGSFTVSVIDPGNGTYVASAPATALVTVQPPFYTLSVAASAGGSVTGGGSYPSGAQATAVAIPDAGNTFAGWTGALTAGSQSVTVLMDSNLSIMAQFTALLPQTISFVPPGTVSTRTPPFSIAATSSSGLPVSLTLVSGPASLSAGVVTPTGAQGEVVLSATQAGNSQYLPAPLVLISFAIGPPPPGVLLEDDSPASKRTDKVTRTTSFRSGPTN